MSKPRCWTSYEGIVSSVAAVLESVQNDAKASEIGMSDNQRNGVLRALSSEDRSSLIKSREMVAFTAGQILEAPQLMPETVLFPLGGVASVTAIGERQKRMETGPIGREGMIGQAVVYDVQHTSITTTMEMPGDAIAVPAATIRSLIDGSPAARSVFLRYHYAFHLQGVHAALAAGLATVERRLARWLLMLHDRAEGDEFQLTHDFIAMMLGVRRPGVTVALHVLEGERLIRSSRGSVAVADRVGLEAFAGSIYGVPEAEYRRVLGEPFDIQTRPLATAGEPSHASADIGFIPGGSRNARVQVAGRSVGRFKVFTEAARNPILIMKTVRDVDEYVARIRAKGDRSIRVGGEFQPESDLETYEEWREAMSEP